MKSFLLELVEEEELSFLPGQWVDLYIGEPALWPEADIIGGFSMTSSPLQKGSIELAVKNLPWGKASVYLNEEARVGELVTIDGGYGSFYYREGMGDSLALIAGGIGITPLMSIIRYVDEADLDMRVCLLYSAATPSELVFLEELRSISARNGRIACRFTVTQPGVEAGFKPAPTWTGRVGRIDQPMLEEAGLDRDALYYLCGPRGFAQDMAALLAEMGVEASRLKREEW